MMLERNANISIQRLVEFYVGFSWKTRLRVRFWIGVKCSRAWVRVAN